MALTTAILSVVLLMVGGLFSLMDTYPTGLKPAVAYPGWCALMVPSPAAYGHGVPPQTSAPIYEIVTNQDCYGPNQEVQVVVRSHTNKTLMGMFIQGRGPSSDNTVGTFSVFHEDLETLMCDNITDSAAGHNKRLDGDWYDLMWTPPVGHTANVRFRSTVVFNKTTFWVDIESEEIRYSTTCKKQPLLSAASKTFMTTTSFILTLGITMSLLFNRN